MTAPGPPRAARGRKRRRPEPGFGGAPTGPRRVAVYLRRSTDDEHQPFSIGAQETALTSYAGTQPGWTLVATYSDDASGATTNRPGLQQALRAARASRFDVLLVYRVDRFSRRLSAARCGRRLLRSPPPAPASTPSAPPAPPTTT
jgi:site-specific DNA recombinase